MSFLTHTVYFPHWDSEFNLARWECPLTLALCLQKAFQTMSSSRRLLVTKDILQWEPWREERDVNFFLSVMLTSWQFCFYSFFHHILNDTEFLCQNVASLSLSGHCCTWHLTSLLPHSREDRTRTLCLQCAAHRPLWLCWAWPWENLSLRFCWTLHGLILSAWVVMKKL